MWNTQPMQNDYQFQIVSATICLTILRAYMNILFIIKMKFLKLIKWSYTSPPPPMTLSVEPRMVNKFWACNPIASKHLSFFGCVFIDPHLTHTPLKYRCPIKKSDHKKAHMPWVIARTSWVGSWPYKYCHAFHPLISSSSMYPHPTNAIIWGLFITQNTIHFFGDGIFYHISPLFGGMILLKSSQL